LNTLSDVLNETAEYGWMNRFGFEREIDNYLVFHIFNFRSREMVSSLFIDIANLFPYSGRMGGEKRVANSYPQLYLKEGQDTNIYLWRSREVLGKPLVGP
jgi:preprotein translocase subunit SecB